MSANCTSDQHWALYSVMSPTLTAPDVLSAILPIRECRFTQIKNNLRVPEPMKVKNHIMLLRCDGPVLDGPQALELIRDTKS